MLEALKRHQAQISRRHAQGISIYSLWPNHLLKVVSIKIFLSLQRKSSPQSRTIRIARRVSFLGTALPRVLFLLKGRGLSLKILSLALTGNKRTSSFFQQVEVASQLAKRLLQAEATTSRWPEMRCLNMR